MAKMTDKVAYLKGLADGMKLTADTDEHKFLLKMLETLEAMAEATDELAAQQEELDEYCDNIDDDLSELEEYVYGEDGEDEDGEDEEEISAGEDTVEYECPHCGYKTSFDIAEFDFEEDYLCPKCSKPFFPEGDGTDDEQDNDGDGAEKSKE